MPTVLESSTVPGLKHLYRLAIVAAAISGGFCVLFVLVLLFNYLAPNARPSLAVSEPPMKTDANFSSDPSYRQPATDAFNTLPTDDQSFLALKRQLASDKSDEATRAAIRDYDRRLRIDFFKRREIIQKTAPLLLLSTIVFLIAARTATVLKRKIPVPSGDASPKARQAEQNRLQLGTLTLVGISTLFAGLALGLFLVPASSFEQMLVLKLQDDLSRQSNTVAGAVVSGAAALGTENPAEQNVGHGITATKSAILPSRPSDEEPPLDRDALLVELEKNWPSFRGFDCTGIGRSETTPVQWNATTDENIAWKTEIPLPGKSSPIIWLDGNDKNDGRLFLTGADEEKRRIFCFDTEDGKLLWTVDAPSTPESAKPVSVSEDTGFAAPSMVVDGRRAFALFANGDLVATDFDGNVLWSKSLGIPESAYGFSASPALYFDRLIVQYDVGDGSDGKSKLHAFDVKTGETVWETPREIGNSWSSPMVKKIADKFQIITCGDPFVISYDPETGKEIWRCRCLSGDVGPSPAAFDKFVYVTNQGPRTSAIDASGEGDVTETKVVWRGTNALPDTPSPIATENRVYTFDSHGYMTAYDPAKINEKNRRAMYWELEIGGGMANFYSSPLLVGNILYAFSMSEDEPAAYVVDLSKAKTDEEGLLDESAAGEMLLSTNPMSEPCVASPAVVNGRLYVRGSKTLYCIEQKP